MVFIWSIACSWLIGFGMFDCAGLCAILMALEFLDEIREDG